MNIAERRYLFQTRPRHRETFKSYSDRVMAMNFETAEHKTALLRAARPELSKMMDDERWFAILEEKTGRTLARLADERTSENGHIDGSSCEHCRIGTEERSLCLLCAHGQTAQLHPHFAMNVCLRHRRWVGPNTAPDAQPTGDDILMAAERTFRKLRKQHLITAPMYLRIRSLVTRQSEPQGSPVTDARNYPTIIAIAELLTNVDFGRKLFDPSQSFASAYEYLVGSLTEVIGRADAHVSRGLWLYLRPSFLSLRESIEDERPFVPMSPHDLPLREPVLNGFKPAVRPLEPFARYLEVTGDHKITRNNYDDVLTHYACPRQTDSSAPRGHRAMICRQGHRTVAASIVGRSRQYALDDNCGICNHSILLTGFNDMATTHPQIAQELDPDKNNGVSARDIFAGSATSYIWTCRRGDEPHDFPATASNRTANNASCSVCLNRLIIIGVNDLETLHPRIAAEFNHEANGSLDLYKLPPGSNTIVSWKCRSEHEFRYTVGERTRGRSCPKCPSPAKTDRTIAVARPDLAAELHPTRNRPRTAYDLPIGSHIVCFWVCPRKNHTYEQTPERRNAGYGCSLCSGKAFQRGVNDPATLHPKLCSEWHPYLNGTLNADDREARKRHIWWQCTAHQHVTRQTLIHRVQSGGCTECPVGERIATESKN